MSRPWYPFYFSDYEAKTSHLTLAEHGAYSLLMGAYYKTGKPLPANAVQLQKICRVFADDEVAALHSVLRQYFILRDGFYYNSRCEEEIEKANNISKVRSESASSRYANAGANAGANAYTTTITTTTTGTDTSKLVNHPPTPKGSFEYTPDFLKFWDVYPKQKNKGTAFKAWKKIKPTNGLVEEIINGVHRAKESTDWKKENGQFIPYPASWLNARGWEDQPSAGGDGDEWALFRHYDPDRDLNP